MYSISWPLIVDLNIFIIVATVAIGLQTCAKMLQMHLLGGEGTPWMQSKSNVTFTSASLAVFEFLVAYCGFKYFYYCGNCSHRVANLWKNTANALFRKSGDTLDATQKQGNF